MERRAKIVATVGPATATPRALAALLRAGADVVRLNLSHGTEESHRATLRLVRAAAARLDRHVPVILDLMGPRFRLGELRATRQLVKGQRVTLGARGRTIDLPVDDPAFLRHLHKGERVLIDNGLVELAVEAKRRDRVVARVVFGGTVSTRKGINLPDTPIPFAISPKDRADIRFAIAEGADYLAASYVGSGRDVDTVRALVRRLGGDIPLVAKLERLTAVEHIADIVAAADAVMVARGDLGVEVRLERVPVLQNQIVAAGRVAGKPVIVATQMLESMMLQPRPTRAESSDVANAVFDGADALMLSGETAAGRFPIAAVRTMAHIIEEAEAYRLRLAAATGGGQGPALPSLALPPPAELEPDAPRGALEIADVVAAAAVHAASRLDGSRIVAFSQGGFTARRLARYRPTAPTFVFTTDARVARRIQLVWGVRPFFLAHDVQRGEDLAEAVERHLLRARRVAPGECIVILMGYPIHRKPLTNLMRIHRVRRLATGRRAPRV